jgi:hypothetical protein
MPEKQLGLNAKTLKCNHSQDLVAIRQFQLMTSCEYVLSLKLSIQKDFKLFMGLGYFFIH